MAQQSPKSALSGFVHDGNNGEAMIGVTLSIKGTRLGCSSNTSGFFIINSIQAGKQKLLVSYMGYRSQEIDVDLAGGETEQLNITLLPETVRLGEVIVSGEKGSLADKLYAAPVSKFDLSAKQINAIPKVIEADLLRALQTMPGITSLSDFSSALYIRGGTADQNLYLIDGTDVYNPDHAFGIFSTFNTNAIKKVEVSKGGFSSEYGGRLSSVIDVINLDGNRNNVEGICNVSLLSGSSTLQIPLGSIGSLSGSLRRTYIDQTYAKWSKDVPEYYFYDANLKGFFDLSEKDKLSVSYFNSRDNLDYQLNKDKPESGGFTYEWGNKTGSVNWKHIFNQNVFGSFWFTGSGFDSDLRVKQLFKLSDRNELTDYAFKASLEYYADNDLSVKFGAEHKFLRFMFAEDWGNGRVDFKNKCKLTTGYLDVHWTPDILWDFTAGVRAGYFSGDKDYFNPEPRFSMKYRLTSTSSIKFATGRYFQYLNRIPRMFLASIWTSTDKYTKPSMSDHFILSYQKQLTDIIQLEVEAYYKTYKDIYQFNQNLNVSITPGYYTSDGLPVYNSTENIFTRGDGNSRGFEILLRKEAGTFNGWLSYTYSKTKNSFDGINHSNEYAPRHDRSSVVNFVLNGDLGDLFSLEFDKPLEKKQSSWTFGLNFVYATGQPITTPASAYYVNTIPDDQGEVSLGQAIPGYKMYPKTINSYRLPAYVRMDICLTYEKNYSGWSIAPYIQIFNIGNRKNTWFINYKSELAENRIVQTVEKVNMLPLLPSIGVNIKF